MYKPNSVTYPSYSEKLNAYHYKPYKLMVFIYLFNKILTDNINNHQINNKITVPGGD